MKNPTILLPAALALFAGDALAQSRDTRFKLLVDGVYALKIDYGESRSFEEFAETGSAGVDYANDAGPGFGAAIQWDFVSRFGIRGGVTYVKRDGTASYEATFPHPLYFNRPRKVSGELTGLSYKETAAHLDLAFTAPAGPIDFSLFAGGSIIKVETELVGTISKNEVYPFDEVAVSNVGRTSASDSPVGFNAGAGLDFRFSDHVAFGAQFFYSTAKAKLSTAAGGTIEVDAGGPHATAGLRFMFSPAGRSGQAAGSSKPKRLSPNPPARPDPLKEKRPTTQPVNGSKQGGWLRVVTDPPGADVYVGDQRAGVTTAAGLLLQLPTGDIVISVRKVGYATVERAVSIAAGDELALPVTLKPEARSEP